MCSLVYNNNKNTTATTGNWYHQLTELLYIHATTTVTHCGLDRAETLHRPTKTRLKFMQPIPYFTQIPIRNLRKEQLLIDEYTIFHPSL